MKNKQTDKQTNRQTNLQRRANLYIYRDLNSLANEINVKTTIDLSILCL